MSRHTFYNEDKELEIAVGWDQPLRTYFAVVSAKHTDVPVLWLGTRYHEIADPQSVIHAVHPHAPAFDEQALHSQLLTDRHEESVLDRRRTANADLDWDPHSPESVAQLQEDLDKHFEHAEAIHRHPFYLPGYGDLMQRIEELLRDPSYDLLLPAPEREQLENEFQQYKKDASACEDVNSFCSSAEYVLKDFVRSDGDNLFVQPIQGLATHRVLFRDALYLGKMGHEIIHNDAIYGPHIERDRDTWKDVIHGLVVLDTALQNDSAFLKYHELYLEPPIRDPVTLHLRENVDGPPIPYLTVSSEPELSDRQAALDKQYRDIRKQWHDELSHAHDIGLHPYDVEGTEQLMQNMEKLTDNPDLANNARVSLREQQAQYNGDVEDQQRVSAFLDRASQMLERHEQHTDAAKKLQSTGLSVDDIPTYSEFKSDALNVIKDGQKILEDDWKTYETYLERSPDVRERIRHNIERLNSAIGREHGSLKPETQQELDEQQKAKQQKSTRRGISF